MTVEQVINTNQFKVISKGSSLDRTIEDIFCCDLLSVAMSNAPAGGAWVTVMANVNTLAVASLTDTAMILLAEGATLDEEAVQKAQIQGITVLACEKSVYHAAKQLDGMIHETHCL